MIERTNEKLCGYDMIVPCQELQASEGGCQQCLNGGAAGLISHGEYRLIGIDAGLSWLLWGEFGRFGFEDQELYSYIDKHGLRGGRFYHLCNDVATLRAEPSCPMRPIARDAGLPTG